MSIRALLDAISDGALDPQTAELLILRKLEAIALAAGATRGRDERGRFVRRVA